MRRELKHSAKIHMVGLIVSTDLSWLLNRLIRCTVYLSEQWLDWHIYCEWMLDQIQLILYCTQILIWIWIPTAENIKLEGPNHGMQGMVVSRIEFNINILLITSGQYHFKFELLRNSLEDTTDTPNSSKLCLSYWFNCAAFWRQLQTLINILVLCSTTSSAVRSNSKVVSEYPCAHCFAFSLSGSIWEHLEGISIAVQSCWVV